MAKSNINMSVRRGCTCPEDAAARWIRTRSSNASLDYWGEESSFLDGARLAAGEGTLARARRSERIRPSDGRTPAYSHCYSSIGGGARHGAPILRSSASAFEPVRATEDSAPSAARFIGAWGGLPPTTAQAIEAKSWVPCPWIPARCAPPHSFLILLHYVHPVRIPAILGNCMVCQGNGECTHC